MLAQEEELVMITHQGEVPLLQFARDEPARYLSAAEYLGLPR